MFSMTFQDDTLLNEMSNDLKEQENREEQIAVDIIGEQVQV